MNESPGPPTANSLTGIPVLSDTYPKTEKIARIPVNPSSITMNIHVL